MGCFRAGLRIGPLAGGAPTLEVQGTVDTGAAFPFVPEDLLRKAGIEPTGEQEFLLADGSHRRFPIGEARLYYENYSAPCLVVFGLPGTEPLFGALALESLRLEVDPVNQRLKPATTFLAAASAA